MQKKTFLTLLPPAILALLTIYWTVIRLVLPEVTLRINGYDPRSLLSGHYLSYTIDWKMSDCGQFAGGACPVKQFDDAAEHLFSNEIRYRYYIPEEYAAQLDKMFAENPDGPYVFEMVFAYSPYFTPRAKKFLINGQDWQHFVRG